MSQQPTSQTGGGTDQLRHQGEQAIGETQRDAERVVRHAGDEAGNVVDTARREVRDVVDEAVTAVSNEADQRTRQAGNALHDLSRDLHRMADGEGSGSTAADYVHAVANTVDRVAGQMDGGSRDMVESIRSTAERRPGTFIGGSMLAGFVMGRLIRNGERPSTGQSGQDPTIDLRGQTPAVAAGEPQAQWASTADVTASQPRGAGQHDATMPPPPPPGPRSPEAF
ncbi:MAG: hypothetical protein ACXIVQ_13575 [Acidimicrobiales bacterium]